MQTRDLFAGEHWRIISSAAWPARRKCRPRLAALAMAATAGVCALFGATV